MSNGILQAYDVPTDLYEHPKTVFVAGFVGNPPMNFYDVEISSSNGDFYAKSEAIDLLLPPERGKKAAAAAKGKVVMGVRPEDIYLVDDATPAVAGRTLSANVEVVEPLGREDLLGVTVKDVDMRVLVDKTKGAAVGDTSQFVFDMANVQFFDPESEQSLLWL
jgi:ABC-type sugar transport system ATPase subunit